MQRIGGRARHLLSFKRVSQQAFKRAVGLLVEKGRWLTSTNSAENINGIDSLHSRYVPGKVL